MSWAVGEGLIAGTPKSDGTYLVPKDSATRAQAAKVLTSFLK